MFFKNLLKIEEVKAKKEIRLAMIERSTDSSLKAIKADSGVCALVQISGIRSVEQETKGWYYKDENRDTIMIKYLDDSWVRLEMLVENFIEQTGFQFNM